MNRAPMLEPDDDRGSFGPLLKRFRVAAGISQEELAERARLSVESVSALERGRRKAPYRETIKMLADALGLDDTKLSELIAAAKAAKPSSKGAELELMPETPKAESTIVAETLLHNLPNAPGTLIGRSLELEKLRVAFERTRLLTIVGAGGAGKTRIAIEFALAYCELNKVITRFVDLGAVRDRSLTANVIATAIAISQGFRATVNDAGELETDINDSPILLVIDNCEHLIEQVSEILRSLIDSSPNLRVLATSREPLQISMETVFRLNSLPVPTEHERLSLDAQTYSSVELFIERARARNTDFILSDAILTNIGQICRRLDGLPLAIELAAAQTHSLSVHDLSENLGRTFDLLTGSNRGVLPRQQTLRALMDWSFALLDPQQQELFVSLSVFAGGWTIKAAQAVCASDRISPEEVVRTLSELVQCSLVIADTTGVETRYRLSEVARAYARDKGADDAMITLLQKHSEWVEALGAEAHKRFWSGPRQPWVDQIFPELDNIRVALATALGANGSAMRAAKILSCLANFWSEIGLHAEGRRWTESALGRIDSEVEPIICGRLLCAFALFATGRAVVEACGRAIQLFEPTGNPRDLHVAHFSMGLGLWQVGELAESLTAINRAADYAAICGLQQTSLYAEILDTRANVLAAKGDFLNARSAFAEACEVFALLSDEHGVARTKGNLAELEFMCGDAERALTLLGEVSAVFERSGAQTRLATALVNSAAYRLYLHKVEEARADALEALALGRRAKNQTVVCVAVQHLATVLALRGEVRIAARLTGFVDAWYEREGYRRELSEAVLYAILRETIAQHLTERDVQTLSRHGATLNEDQATAAVLSAV